MKLKRPFFVLCIGLLCFLTSCKPKNTTPVEEEPSSNNPDTSVDISEYIENLSEDKLVEVKKMTRFLQHPLKEVIDEFGNSYEFDWSGRYVTLTYNSCKCAFTIDAEESFSKYDYYNNPQTYLDYNCMEFLQYKRIETIDFVGTGAKLTDNLTIGESVGQICDTLHVDKLTYDSDHCLHSYYTNPEGKQEEYYQISGDALNINYIVEIKNNHLSHVSITNDSDCLLEDPTASEDKGYASICEALEYVNKKGYATYNPKDLAFDGTTYSSYYGTWFYRWSFQTGHYEGFTMNIEKTAPYRIFTTTQDEHCMFLFWMNGKYVNPIQTFLGRWRNSTSSSYMDVCSVSDSGEVMLNLQCQDKQTKEITNYYNLSTVFDYKYATFDDFYCDDSLAAGNIQYADEYNRCGFIYYDGSYYYLMDKIRFELTGTVGYYTSIGSGMARSFSIHLPYTEESYEMPSNNGYMSTFGRDDPNENIVQGTPKDSGILLDEYFNKYKKTEGLAYSQKFFTYLYDYSFSLNGVTYQVWKWNLEDEDIFLYIDCDNQLIIEETFTSLFQPHIKKLVYEDHVLLTTDKYLPNYFHSSDHSIQISLTSGGWSISKSDAFVKEIEMENLQLISFKNGRSPVYFFKSTISNMFFLGGYIFFDDTTWGASLHITDSNIPDFDIGVYDLTYDFFILDPSIEFIDVPDSGDSSTDVDEKIDPVEEETRIVIRNFSGVILGTITIDAKGNKTVRNFSGVILGYYYVDRDETTDFYGRVITRGDTASALLFTQNS